MLIGVLLKEKEGKRKGKNERKRKQGGLPN